MQTLRLLYSWAGRLKGWLLEAKYVGIMLAGWAAAIGVAYLCARNWQVAASLLQFAGTLLIGVRLASRLRLFNEPTLTEIIQDWFRRFPKLREGPVVLGGSIATGTRASGRISPYVRTEATADASLDERVDVLEANVDHLFEQVRDLEQEARKEADSVRALIRRSKAELESAMERVQEQVREYAIGDMQCELIGFAWLIIGLFMGVWVV